MKKYLLFLCVFLIVLTEGRAQALKLQGHVERQGKELYLIEGIHKALVDKETVTVVLKPGKEIPNQIKVINENCLGYIDLAVPNDTPVESFVNQLEDSNMYELIKYNLIGKLCNTTINDQYAYNQWYLESINMYDAWDYTMGCPDIKAAVIDGDFDYSHPDLYYGYDTYRNLLSEQGYNYTNLPHSTFHGTCVSGIIAAKTNNSVCVAGIAGGNNSEGVRILPYNIASASFPGAIHACYVDDAIILAVNNGAKIINMSFSISTIEPNVPDVISAINYAYNHGVTMIAATGNDFNSQLAFPASNDKVIAVGALTTSLQRKDSSNYGVGLDLTAPGENIWTTGSNGTFQILSNTSAAAPQVSGVAALMLSVNSSLNPQEIRGIINHTATKLTGYSYNGYGWNNEVGHGMLNARQAVKAALDYGDASLGASIIFQASDGNYGYWTSNYTIATNTFSIQNSNVSSYPWVEAELYRLDGNGNPSTLVTYWENISTTNASIPGNTPGWYLFRVRGYNATGFTYWLEQEIEMVDMSSLLFTLDYDSSSECLIITLNDPLANTESKLSEQYEIQLWNSSGTKMLKTYKTDLKNYQISLAGLPSGIYIVRIIIEGKTHSRKFIKR